MPIPFGTSFVGRLDPKLDRQNMRMIVNRLLAEEKTPDEKLITELAVAMHKFLDFHEVSDCAILKTQPKELKHMLTDELSRS